MARWTLCSDELRHGGHLTVRDRRFRSDDGTERSWEVIDRGAVVCVLALRADDGRAVLVRQWRPGPQRDLTELPAGFVDDGEEAAAAAARELSEETGYSGSLREVARLPTDGYSDEVRHVFVCTDAVPGDAHPDDGEDLEVVLVDLAGLRDLLRAGAMTTTDCAYVALDALGLLG